MVASVLVMQPDDLTPYLDSISDPATQMIRYRAFLEAIFDEAENESDSDLRQEFMRYLTSKSNDEQVSLKKCI